MADIVLFGDARAEVVAALTAALAPRTETYAVDVPVSGRLPSTTQGTDATPRVYVSEGFVTSTIRKTVQYVTVPVNVWHNTDADAHDLAQLALALLIDSHSGQMAACKALTGPTVTPDPDTGHWMASFTVRAAMAGRLSA